MNKRIKSMLMVFVMVISMLATAVPASAAGTSSFKMTADKTTASPGETITYTIKMGPVNRLDSMKFTLKIPAGLTFVAGSGKLADNLATTLKCVDTAWTELTKIYYATLCDEGTGYSSATDTELMTFQCTVDNSAAGDLKIDFIIDPEDCYDPDYDNITFSTSCDTVTIKAAEAHTHTMVKTDAKASTCKEQGNNEYYTCSGCGKVYKDAEGKTETTVAAETLPLADHTWGEWTEVKAATETEKGLEERVCSVCGAKETRDIPVLSHTHTMVKTDAKASTCKEQGNNEYYTCSGCGKVYKDAEGKVETTVAAETLPLADHTWGEWAVTKEATATEAGIETRTCSVCSETETRDILPLNCHTITFDANGGTVAIPTAVTGTDGKLASLPTPTRSSYSFKGWYTASTDGTQVTTDTFFTEDSTVYAQWTYTGSSSSGGGGVSTYTITVDSAKNGAVTSSHKSAAKGTTVTITVKPDKGFELDTLTVTDGSGKKVSVAEKSGKYTFTMPASKVTVQATFKAEAPVIDHPFTDVPEGSYYEDAVIWAVGKGVTGGTSATTFSPNGNCTRAQAVTFLWRAAGSPEPKTSTMPFTDVKADSYYHDAVLWAVEQGITKGTSDTAFSPNASCTRAQIVTFLWRANGSPAVSGNSAFTDVAADAYYAAAVTWAEKNDITGGIGGLFGSNNNCTRAQIVTFIYRSVK